MSDENKGTISEVAIFELISYSGDARSYIYEAFEQVKAGDYQEADALLEKSEESIIQAHNMQTSLIHEEARGNKVELGLILVHAQDHLMSTLLAKELVRHMIGMQKEINGLKGIPEDK